jgi:hypothetical protein
MRQPGLDKTGPVPVKMPIESLPVEQLIQQRKEGQAAPAATTAPGVQMMPIQAAPNPGLAGPGGVAK